MHSPSVVPCSFCITSLPRLHCLASLHQQPQSEPSIISLTSTHSYTHTHSASPHRLMPAASTWNGNMLTTKLNVFFFLVFFFVVPPEFDPHTPLLTILHYFHLHASTVMRNRFVRKGKREAGKSGGGSRRVSITSEDGPLSLLSPPQQHRQPTDRPTRPPAWQRVGLRSATQVTLLPPFISVYWHVRDCNNIGQGRDI